MSQICTKMVNFLFQAYFVRHFCYHSNSKSKIKANILHLGYSSNKPIGCEIDETQLSISGSRGGQICPLMHVALFILGTGK